jgi:ADP-heptose:LPS heptosyltransferase
MTLLAATRDHGIGIALSWLFRRAVASPAHGTARERRLFSALARRLDVAGARRRYRVASSFIAVQPSVLNHAETPRRWPRGRFVALIDRLHREHRAVVLLGDRHEAGYAAELAAACATPPHDLVGRTTWTDAVALILASDALVCHDGGLLYIANALAHPVVALLGPSAAVESAPLVATTRVVHARMPCAPCIGDAGDIAALRACHRELACMARITVDDVCAALPLSGASG